MSDYELGFELNEYYTDPKLSQEDYKYAFYQLFNELYMWWTTIANYSIIVIYDNGNNKLITSQLDIEKEKIKLINKKWLYYHHNHTVKAIIWSNPDIDVFKKFIHNIIINCTVKKLEKLISMKDLSSYLVKKYDKYFIKKKNISDKDYTF